MVASRSAHDLQGEVCLSPLGCSTFTVNDSEMFPFGWVRSQCVGSRRVLLMLPCSSLTQPADGEKEGKFSIEFDGDTASYNGERDGCYKSRSSATVLSLSRWTPPMPAARKLYVYGPWSLFELNVASLVFSRVTKRYTRTFQRFAPFREAAMDSPWSSCLPSGSSPQNWMRPEDS